jgi:hypothetical protein
VASQIPTRRAAGTRSGVSRLRCSDAETPGLNLDQGSGDGERGFEVGFAVRDDGEDGVLEDHAVDRSPGRGRKPARRLDG